MGILRVKTSEDQLQRATADLMKFLGWFAWHTPNGGLRDAGTAIKLKAMGVLPGVSDWLILEPWACGCETGFMVAIELKVGGNKPTSSQDRFMRKAETRGVLTGVCYSMNEFLDVLRSVKPHNGRMPPRRWSS